MKKKLLSLLVVFAMALSMVPMVSAAGYVAPPTLAEVQAACDAADNYGILRDERFTPGVWSTAENDPDYLGGTTLPVASEVMTGTVEIRTVYDLQKFVSSANTGSAIQLTGILKNDIDCHGASLSIHCGTTTSQVPTKLLTSEEGRRYNIYNFQCDVPNNPNRTTLGGKNVGFGFASIRCRMQKGILNEGENCDFYCCLLNGTGDSNNGAILQKSKGGVTLYNCLNTGGAYNFCRLVNTIAGDTSWVHCAETGANSRFAAGTANGNMTMTRCLSTGSSYGGDFTATQGEVDLCWFRGGDATKTTSIGVPAAAGWTRVPLYVTANGTCDSTGIVTLPVGTPVEETVAGTDFRFKCTAVADATSLSLGSPMGILEGTTITFRMASFDVATNQYTSESSIDTTAGTHSTLVADTELGTLTILHADGSSISGQRGTEDGSTRITTQSINGVTKTYEFADTGANTNTKTTVDASGSIISTTTDPETGKVTVQTTTLDENGNPEAVTITTTDPKTGETKETTVSPASAVTVKENGDVEITGEVEVTTTTKDKRGNTVGEPTTTKVNGADATGDKPTLGKDGGVSATPGTKITPNGSDTPIEVPEGQTFDLPADTAGGIQPGENGTISLPAGTTVSNSDGTTTTLTSQSEVSSDGSMSGEEFSQGDTTLTGENGEKINVKKNEDGSIDAPANTTVNANGTSVTTTGEGQVKVNADGSMDVTAGVTLTVAGEEVTAAGTTTVAPNGTVSTNNGENGQTDYSANGAVITFATAPVNAGIWTVETESANDRDITAAMKAASIEIDGREWSPQFSDFFEIKTVDGADTQPGVSATVSIPFSGVAATHPVMYWDGAAWTNDGVSDYTTDGTNATFTTTHFSHWTIATSTGPHFFATVELLNGAEDLVADDTDVDDSGFEVNDLNVGDRFRVDVKSSIPFINSLIYVKFNSDFLELTNDPTAEGWVLIPELSSGNMQFYYMHMTTGVSDGEYAANTPIGMNGDDNEGFQFELKVPEGFSSSELPMQVPFEFCNETRLQVTESTSGAGTYTPMDYANTWVNLNGMISTQVVEVVPYGENTALVLVYSRNAGVFTFTDDQIFETANGNEAALKNVTAAGYIYRNDKASTAQDEDAELMTAADFYAGFTGTEAPYVYGVVVSTTRLFDATGADSFDGENKYDIEKYVLERLTFDGSRDALINMDTIAYGDAKGDVNLMEGSQTDDESWVIAIALAEGTLKDEEATGWALFLNDTLSGNAAVALRTDFVRDTDDNPDTNDTEVTKVVGDPEMDVYAAMPLY